MYLMGLDVGTTGVKALLISDKGEQIAEANNSYPLLSPKTNWYEQNPEDWWNGTVMAIQRLIKESHIDASEIRGIGLSGQYHGLVLIDKNQRVLRPSILWNDQRTAKQSEYIIGKVGKDTLKRIAATQGAPYFTACKLLWVRENEPEIYEKIYKLMLPKDYVRFKLTGEFATDVTDASGTLFLDVRKRKWSSEMLNMLDVDSSFLPALFESLEVTGKITSETAELTGLKPGIPVAGGGGDQACAAVGNGIIEEGLIAYSIGTSGVIYAATETVRMDPQGRLDSFCHAVPGQWCLLACINAAAGSLGWFQEQFSDWERHVAKEKETDVYTILEEKASEIPSGSDKLFFLPYLAGERHPHPDPDAKGVFFGFHLGHTKSHAIRAVLEGVAYSFRECLEAIKDHDIKIKEIRATGGGAKSKLWIKIQADVSAQPIVLTHDAGGAAFGAAILGGVGAGVYSTVQEACGQLVKTYSHIEPDKKEMKSYEHYFRFFQSVYPLLKDSYKRLSEL